MTSIRPTPPAEAASAGGRGFTLRVTGPVPAGVAGPQTALVLGPVATNPLQTLLQLPGGVQVAVTLTPPLPPGATLSFSLPAGGEAPLLVTARLATPVAAPPVPTPAAISAPAAAPAAPTLVLANAPAALQSALAANRPATPVPVPATTTPPPLLPPGPVLLQPAAHTSLPPALTQAATGTLATLVLGPPAPAVTASATTPAPPQAGLLTLPGGSTIPVQATLGAPLPTGTRITVALPGPAAPAGATLTASAIGFAPPTGTPPPASAPLPDTAQLAQLRLLPSPPTPPPAATAPAANTAPPPPAPALPAATLAARVLAPLAPDSLSQPVLLANGQQAVLQWSHELARAFPQGLPPGSTLMAELSLLGQPGSISRVDTGGGQGQAFTPAGGRNAPPATATPLPPPPAPGTVVQGTVTAANPADGSLTLSMATPGSGTLSLKLLTPQPLPPGSVLTLRIEPPAVAHNSPTTPNLASVLALQLPPGYAQTHTLTELSQRWPALEEGLALLQRQAPLSAAALAERLPRVAALLPGLLPYLDAVQRTQPERAFGQETVALLKALGIDFGADFTQLQQLGQPGQAGAVEQWRGVLFPYLENPQEPPQQGGFFWRRQRQGTEDPESATNLRFVVQLSLSQLGPLQLDGLLSYPDVWLKLRRQTPAEPGFLEGLQQVVAGTLAGLGLGGGIGVEVVPRFEVDPVADLLAQSQGTLAAEV